MNAHLCFFFYPPTALPSGHLGFLSQMTTSCMCDRSVFFRASVFVTEDGKDTFHNTKLQDGENVTGGINKVLTLPCADRFLSLADIQILHTLRTVSSACLRLFGAIIVILQLRNNVLFTSFYFHPNNCRAGGKCRMMEKIIIQFSHLLLFIKLESPSENQVL